jgi:hypothetical protein
LLLSKCNLYRYAKEEELVRMAKEVRTLRDKLNKSKEVVAHELERARMEMGGGTMGGHGGGGGGGDGGGGGAGRGDMSSMHMSGYGGMMLNSSVLGGGGGGGGGGSGYSSSPGEAELSRLRHSREEYQRWGCTS